MSLFFLLPTAAPLDTALAADSASIHNIRNGNTYSGITVAADGVQYYYSAAGTAKGTSMGTWPVVGVVGDFWIRCTVNAGTLDAGSSATGSWLACTSDRSWYIVDAGADDGAETADFDLEIAIDAAGANIIDTQNYTPRAEYLTV